ncbi:ribonuclease H-like protein [Annulohypoxylon truncatum]|uniref:ribonuclease H-like protein n=1 Tax=Annulohypoxylon truncatum TaxID=327061 RepID=UPI00200814FE|nr:ribonuclease H-like protein [Annulohypoxylon truncatum]KAI1206795.1 ribonuclease H-like protein [Annulohypoxylon truncatum]
MPLGWYLAQGLYPLGPSSSDDEEGPCELPDGRIVCGPHGLVTCGKCCTDYSFADLNSKEVDGFAKCDTDDENPRINEQELLRLRKKRGTGQVFPTQFTPPTGSSIMPTELFPSKEISATVTRYIHRNDTGAVLVFTDGACLNNGKPDPKAGWAFVQGPGRADKPALISARLEIKGPWGDESIQSSNRAELRAVIAALRYQNWPGEGFRTITIATDSEYVVEGSTKWAKTWVTNNWKTSVGADVKNKDLWEMLMGEAEKWKDQGLSIQFWRIPREWNEVADEAAKKAASEFEDIDGWTDYLARR